MNLKPATLSRIDEVITHYPVKRSAVLPLLHLIQEEQGYLSKDAIEWVATKLELAPINVLEVATFYPMFRLEPVGRCHIKVCRTLSCALRGGYRFAPSLRNSSASTAARPRPTAKSPSTSSSAWQAAARAPSS